jgi:hypothetical protein
MRERPILFSAPMVRAVLAVTKTQTRRIVKPQPLDDAPELATHLARRGHYEWFNREDQCSWKCPYGAPGDRLWVREAWADLTATHGQRWERFNEETRLYERGTHPFIWYRADGDQPDTGNGALNQERWRPSIYLPRWASRILLEVTGVRIERLQEISEADAIAEGLFKDQAVRWTTWSATEEHREHLTPIEAYRELWEAINGRGSWDANPWVWVISFRRIQ